MENLHLLNLKRQINKLSLNERDELLKILNKPVVRYRIQKGGSPNVTIV